MVDGAICDPRELMSKALEYDWPQLTLGRERTAQRALADQLYAAPRTRAVFAPLLGFSTTLVLTQAGADVATAPGVVASEHDRRPTCGPRPM